MERQNHFLKMGVAYDDFRALPMHEKMEHIRKYARGRLKKGERLWWLEDAADESHTLPIEARLFTELETNEKTRLRAQAILLCPEIVKSRGAKHKYDNAALFMLTYHGVLCHQTRDMFSAGSVSNPANDDKGWDHIPRMLSLIEGDLLRIAPLMEAALFEEYWDESVSPEMRIPAWITKADEFARGLWKIDGREWVPSRDMFDGRYAHP